MAPKTFAASLDQFAIKTAAKMKWVAEQAIQDVVEAAQTPQVGITMGATSFEEGKVPIGKTGDLQNSLVSGRNGSVVGTGEASYEAAISGYELGDTLQFAWTMEYAYRIELGFVGTDSLGRTYNQAGRHFVGKNAAEFPRFVAERAAEVKDK